MTVRTLATRWRTPNRLHSAAVKAGAACSGFAMTTVGYSHYPAFRGIAGCVVRGPDLGFNAVLPPFVGGWNGLFRDVGEVAGSLASGGLAGDAEACPTGLAALLAASSIVAQHFLYLWPDPQWQGLFLPSLIMVFPRHPMQWFRCKSEQSCSRTATVIQGGGSAVQLCGPMAHAEEGRCMSEAFITQIFAKPRPHGQGCRRRAVRCWRTRLLENYNWCARQDSNL